MTVLVVCVACLAAICQLTAAGEVILAGLDVWITPPDGSTLASFADDPIPAGFFCQASEIFDGTIAFMGRPVEVVPQGSLGEADTLVLRTTDAELNAELEATTMAQVVAMNLVSIEPVETVCGPFNVAVTLNGPQPLTEMQIIQENAFGGTYHAPLTVNVTLSFTPVADPNATPLVLGRAVDFMASPTSTWAWLGGVSSGGAVEVDVDGDLVVDTLLPGTSNFSAGFLAIDDAQQSDCEPICHCDPYSKDPSTPSCYCAHLHCIYPAGCDPIAQNGTSGTSTTTTTTNGTSTSAKTGTLPDGGATADDDTSYRVPDEYVAAARQAACP
jgi:hypothetical protein